MTFEKLEQELELKMEIDSLKGKEWYFLKDQLTTADSENCDRIDINACGKKGKE